MKKTSASDAIITMPRKMCAARSNAMDSNARHFHARKKILKKIKKSVDIHDVKSYSITRNTEKQKNKGGTHHEESDFWSRG